MKKKKTDLVKLVKNTPVVSTLDMWGPLEVNHKSIMSLLKKYESKFQETRLLTFEMLVTNKKGQPLQYCYLDEEQATFLITLLRNSDPVVNFKRRLTGEFYRMRSEILRLQSIISSHRTDPEWLDTRKSGKGVLRGLTDSIKLLEEYATGQGSTHADKYFTSIPRMINKALFVISPQVKNVRDALDVTQLKHVSTADYIAETVIQGEMAMGSHYKQVYPKAKAKVETFAEKVGKTPVPKIPQIPGMEQTPLIGMGAT